MEFILTKKQELVRKAAREFAEKEIGPIASQIDETGIYPEELWRKLGKYKMLSIPLALKYGGAGGDYISYAITVEELSKKCASTGTMVSGVSSLYGWLLETFGTEKQKENYLMPVLSGDKVGSFALTEPEAGTDASNQQTTAVLKDDYYLLNGSKCFITNGGISEYFIVFAMTDKSKGIKGISSFIVEREYEGFSIGKHENKMGIRGTSTTELIFQNVKVPKENIIGKEGKGFKIAMATLDVGRIGIAAQALGIAQGALDETIKYVKERRQFKKTIGSFQGIQWIIADMETRVNAARWLVYNSAYRKSEGLSYTKESAMAKLYAAETASYVTNRAVQLHGGYGFIKDYPVERMMRDAKITEIYEGTSEVQKMVIAANVLR